MPNIITFSDFEQVFDKLNTNNFIEDNLKKQLFDFFPKMFFYEEEGKKLRFSLLIIKDLSKNKKKLSNYLFKNLIKKDKKEEIFKYLKSIAPFSQNGWDIFISIEEDGFIFGIYKNFGGINSLTFKDIVKKDYIEIFMRDFGLIEFENGDETLFLHLSINQSDVSINQHKNILNLTDVITSGLKESNNLEKFKKNLSDLLFFAFKESHGNIIVVQDFQKKIDGFFKEGIFFDEPIDLYNEYIDYINTCSKDETVIQRYYSLSGVFKLVLDIDGIVIIDNQAKLLGYNIFVKSDNSFIDGGARKRAYESIINADIDGVIGVYFQSQDGFNEFREFNNGK